MVGGRLLLLLLLLPVPLASVLPVLLDFVTQYKMQGMLLLYSEYVYLPGAHPPNKPCTTPHRTVHSAAIPPPPQPAVLNYDQQGPKAHEPRHNIETRPSVGGCKNVCCCCTCNKP